MQRVNIFVIPKGTGAYDLFRALRHAEEHGVKRIDLGTGYELEDGAAAVLGEWLANSKRLERLDMTNAHVKSERGYRHLARGIKRHKSDDSPFNVTLPADMCADDLITFEENL